MKNVDILCATIDDAKEILDLQKLAYQSEAERYNDYDIPPLKQTIDEIKEHFRKYVFLKAVSEGALIGSVRAFEENGTCYIGRLAVNPDMKNQGIGTTLMKEIERYYKPDRFELFTVSKSYKNIYLYQKLGYNTFRTEKYKDNIEVLYMEKFHKNI